MNAVLTSEVRRIPVRRPIIAIDGPAGAGKSTIAQHLARHYGLLNLETGAMYRAFALKAQAAGANLDDVSSLMQLAAKTVIHLEPQKEGNRVLLDGEDVTARLRSAEVTDGASRVSVHQPIRAWMVGLQQALGAAGGVVMEGRDIGTVVFPHADVKIFLDASPEVRGLRRYDQMGQSGHTGERESAVAERPPDAIVKELRTRDERDRNRVNSPLRPASDAVILDSTYLTLDEVLEHAEAIVNEKLSTLSPHPTYPNAEWQ